jgi:hypothetical protein
LPGGGGDSELQPKDSAKGNASIARGAITRREKDSQE